MRNHWLITVNTQPAPRSGFSFRFHAMSPTAASHVLVIGTAPDTLGGITSVIESHRDSFIWSKWNCIWLGSNTNKGNLRKIVYFVVALVRFCFLLPRTSIIHVHMTFGMSAFRKAFFVYPAWLLKKKIIIQIHSPLTTELEATRAILRARRLLSKADVVAVLTYQWKRLVESEIPGSLVELLPNACPRSCDPLAFRLRKNIILYLGVLNERKGYRDLLCAFSRIAGSHPEWELHFAGNGDIDSARRMVSRLNLTNRVFIHGWVAGEKKAMLLSSSKIFCLPSYAEGSPVSILEGFSYGLAVVMTPVGDFPSILSEGHDVLFIRAGDREQLAIALDSLMANPEKLIRLSQRSIELAKTLFSYQQWITRLDSLYTRLSQSRV